MSFVMGRGFEPALAIVMQVAIASSCYAAQKGERFIIGHGGAPLQLILKDKKSKMIAGPDAELIIVSLGPHRLATYRLETRTYMSYTPEQAIEFNKFNRPNFRAIKWQNWSPAGSDTICDTAVKKWIRHGIPQDNRYAKTKFAEEIWAAQNLALSSDMRIQYAALLDSRPPSGIAFRDIITINEPGRKPQVIVKVKAVKHEFVDVKDSDFLLPAQMKEVDDWWALFAPAGAHESLFMMKE